MDDLTLSFNADAGTTAARGLDEAGAAVDKIASGALPDVSAGTTIDDERGVLAEVRRSLNAAADAAAAAAAAEQEGHAAWQTWRKIAPPLSAVEDAQKAVAAAGKALSAAAGTSDAGAAREKLNAANSRLADLLQQRDDAARNLTEALKRATEHLRTRRRGKAEGDAPGNMTAPGKASVPEHTGAAPKSTAPGPAAPAAHTPVAAPVAPAATGTTSPISPTQAANIAALMAGQQRQGQPAPIPQPRRPAPLSPPTAPAASMGAGGSPRDGKSAITADDIDSITPLPLPLSSAAHVTPQSPAPVAPAPPAPPAVTGTSSTGWHTGADTTGRPDNAPRTALSSGVPEQLTGRAAAGGAGAAGTPQGPPLGQQPMMPMMPGSMGGAGAAGRPTKVLKYSSEQAELNGHETIGAAVKGGTMAQRPVDAA
jgi:hypothetical protein